VASRDERLGGPELMELRDAVVNGLRERFPTGEGVCTIVKHRGAWTKKSVTDYSRRAPALIVIAHGTTEAQKMGTANVRTDLSMSVVAMAKVRDGDADDPCLLLVRALLGLVPGNNWDMPCASGAVNVRSQNLYSGELDGKGVNLWSVSWEQPIDLPALTEAEFAALNDYLTTHAEHTPDGATEDDPEQSNTFEMRPS